LSERNFTRILQDAHDADIIDLRRRGSDYEVAPAAAATSVSDQLAAAEPVKAIALPAPTAPTGMGARAGGPARGRGRGPIGARVGIVPPDLLSVGVVETSRPASEPVFVESVPDLPLAEGETISDSDLKPRSGRKRATASEKRPSRARKSASSSDEDTEKPAPRRAARKSKSRTASE
jgi:hypothetical protein